MPVNADNFLRGAILLEQAFMDLALLDAVPDLMGRKTTVTLVDKSTLKAVLLLGLTRVVFAMSRDGLLPRSLSHTGKHGTPVRLQIAVGVVMALIAACCNVGILSDMVNIGTLSAFTLVAISIPIMRKKRPDLPRAFKMPGSPWIPILIAVANFWLMLNLSVLTWIRFVVWLVVGFAIYFGYGYWHARLGKGDLTETLSAETDKAVNG